MITRKQLKEQNEALKKQIIELYEGCFLINVHGHKIKKENIRKRAKEQYFQMLNNKEKLGLNI